MIKALKWAYERGADHERTRIKNILQNYRAEGRKRWEEFDQFRSSPGVKGRPNPSKKLEIDMAAMDLITALIEPRSTYGEHIVERAPIDRDE